MTSHRPTQEQIDTVHRYLAAEFPGSVQRSWWEEDTMTQVFEIENGAMLRRVALDVGMFRDCPDCAAALSLSDLADYMREWRTPKRCFHVLWYDRILHIRLKAL